MRGLLKSRGWKVSAFLGGVLYAFFLITAPFEHHDIACHLKTPQHCTSCNSSLVGSDPQTFTTPGASNLVDLGRAIAIQQTADGVLLASRTTGRSPPARS